MLTIIRITSLILLLISFKSIGCSCGEREPTVHFNNAVNVIYGRVVGKELLTDEDGIEYKRITFSNIEVIKGTETNVIYSAIDDGSCTGTGFMLGYNHIIFTYQNNWVTGHCGGTEVILPGIDSLDNYLESIKQLRPNKGHQN